jgi:MoxR-like ATPase
MAEAERLLEGAKRLRAEVGKRIVGQREAIDELLMALLAGGHALLVGVPGLAKTLMIRSLADALDLQFHRVQFTPDLVPSDITGTEILEEDGAGGRHFRFVRGPVFTNILLADEINRAPPRTQAALLEAMQEHRVTAAGETMVLPEPFFVLATQNPIEQEGTYPDEVAILRATTGAEATPLTRVLTANDALALQALTRQVAAADPILSYAASLVRASRPEGATHDLVRRYVRWGAGPRAGQALVLGAKAHALLDGRMAVTPSDVRRVAPPVLRHRILTNFAAQAEGVTAEHVVTALLAEVPAPASGLHL